ncbi:glycerol kinase GlpK [Membranicola marinus]|uniref:Glycerol kinase n=1 Tax=Membranihabitans marinus TaxID=1227546 RepID=A0A953HKW8_9BACT|nr:glycerol kinase GlpK [Membranihabitans marinus]MBY5957532.1 glycerol kinase GlpK [Membranihabitans marinus]
MSKKYILALDQGTTSSRAIIFNHSGEIISVAQKPFQQYFPKAGWVEHDAQEIWSTQSSVAAEVVAQTDLDAQDIEAIGITNQRETTVVWDTETQQPIHRAIVWQDRRTSDYCEELKAAGHADMIRDKTGLIIDAYFSATKLKWILDNVEGAREKAAAGRLKFGTVDSWLIYKFTKGATHATDITNASRTMLYNIHDQCWDQELLDLFDIPAEMMPEVKSNSEVFGETANTLFPIPITGVAGDQQSALFGQMCLERGMAKTTYGTGCFLVMNTGEEAVQSDNNLLTTVAWKLDDKVTYALEGSVFIGGAAIQWLRDGLGLLSDAADSEAMATAVEDNDGVYFVPALSGLAAPYWDQFARGTLVGLTRGTTKNHIVRAALEGIAYQVADVLKAMEQDMQSETKEMRVDGGAVKNNFMMQFQADILRSQVIRPKVMETTAMGAAYLAGLATGYWKSIDDIQSQWQVDREFDPEMESEAADQLLKRWHAAVERSRGWEKTNEN